MTHENYDIYVLVPINLEHRDAHSIMCSLGLSAVFVKSRWGWKSVQGCWVFHLLLLL